jgi:hypothetical protein
MGWESDWPGSTSESARVVIAALIHQDLDIGAFREGGRGFALLIFHRGVGCNLKSGFECRTVAADGPDQPSPPNRRSVISEAC